MDTLIRRIATAASLALVVVVAVTTAQIFWPRTASGASAPEPAYKVGDAIDTPAEWHAGSPYTLVVFAQASCGACLRAEPYLRGLVEHLSGRAAVVMASPGRSAMYDAEFAAGLGVPPERIHTVPVGARVRATPTLVLVDRAGTILGSWEGVGPDEGHAALTAAIDDLIDS